MEIENFDRLFNYISNVRFTDKIQKNNDDIFYTKSLVGMMGVLEDYYQNLKDELIDLKSNTDFASKDIFDANLIRMINKLERLEFFSNYNIAKIKNWLEDFRVKEVDFFKWYNQNHEDNDLYNILNTHISWLSQEMSPDDIIIYPFLTKYDTYDIQAMHRFFDNYIKDHYVNKTLRFLNDQKFENIDINDIFPFKNALDYDNFKTYVDNHIIDSYNDYSYLFQRLKKEKMIERLTHKEFMDWLKINRYITPNRFQEFYEKGNFVSLSKISSGQRVNNFNNIFKL